MTKAKLLPSQEWIRERVHYDPDTGLFTWLTPPPGPQKVGSKAGYVGEHGYIYLMLARQTFRAQRIAWKYMTGEEPPPQVDHRDTNKANNRWDNLRKANDSENKINTGLTTLNTSGFKGVCFDKANNKWRAMIRKNGKLYNLGRRNTPEEAHALYRQAAARLHGEFARFK